MNMGRLFTAIKTDITVQIRTKLYTIGIGAGILAGILVAWLTNPEHLALWILALMLLVVGASTIVYITAMIIFEKEQGTLSAHIVSPLRTSEYLWSKTISLSVLAIIEAIITIGIAMFMMSFSSKMVLPNIPLLFAGIAIIGIIYTLIGIVLIVRFNKFIDSLFLMSLVATILQLPVVYFLDWIKLPLLLIIPTSAPTMLIQGAYIPLADWQWLYAIGYTVVGILCFAIWAQRAFQKHIILK